VIAGDPDDPRQAAHVLVGQGEALLHIAGQDGVKEHWWPGGVPDVRTTFQELANRAGRAHAEIASGMHDEALALVVGDTLGRPKVGLLRAHLVRSQDHVRGKSFERAASWLKVACGIGSSALGSLSFIPGVAAIQEGLDLIPSGMETLAQLTTNDEKNLPDEPVEKGR
jgi:hypothetical protein